MKHFRSLLIGLAVVCLIMIPLAGCVGVPQSEFEALQAEYEALQAEQATVVGENTSLKGEIETAEADLADLRAEYDTLKAEYEALQSFREELVTELNDIKEVYPPRDFSSLRELQDWLLANDVSEKPVTTYAEDWYGRALELQEDALRDGYLVSVDYDYNPETDAYLVYCTTVINGRIFFWDPETDEVLEEYALGTVK